MRRGMTLLEVVLSITLLTALMLVLTSWTRLFGSVDDAAEPARWEVAAESVLQRIHEDLLTGDFTAADSEGDARQEERVRLEKGELRIATRRVRNPGGPVLHAYGRDLTRRQLTVREGAVTTGRRPAVQQEPRVLLTGVADWTCKLDGDDDSELFVEITSDSGRVRSRRYRLP